MKFNAVANIAQPPNRQAAVNFLTATSKNSRYLENLKISNLHSLMSRGIGGQLLIGIEKIAIANRISPLWVMSSISQGERYANESIDFYRKYGYIIGGEVGFFSIGSIWIPCRMLHKELKVPSRAQLLLQKLTFKR